MAPQNDRSGKKGEKLESGDTSTSLNIDTNPGNTTDENVEPTPHSTSPTSENFPVYRQFRSSNTREWNLEMDPNSNLIINRIVERQRGWIPKRWAKRFDGKRVSMDPQSSSLTPARYSNPQTSREVLHPVMSGSGYVEPVETPPDAFVPTPKIGVQPLYDDGENTEAINLPGMANSSQSGSNGEPNSTVYSFLFTRIRAFLGLAPATDKGKAKKRKIQPRLVYGIDKKSEIKCFDCGRNWDELVSEGTYIRITKCGHFLCNKIVRKLAKTGEKCPQCKQIKVYKSDCKICRLEQ